MIIQVQSHYRILTIAACALFLVAVSSSHAHAQEILRDNGLFFDCGTATPGERKTLVTEATSMDDFLIESLGAVVTGVRTLFAVDPPDGPGEQPPGGFTGSDVLFYDFDPETTGPICDPFAVFLDLETAYKVTGDDVLGFSLWVGETHGLDLIFEPGHYFVGGRLVDSGQGRAWIAMNGECGAEIQLSESWFQSVFFGFPECVPSSEAGAFPWDLAFQVLGFVLGEPGQGFFRNVTPIVFTGEPEGGVAEVRESDDARYIIQAGPGFNAVAPHSALVEFTTTLPSLPLERLDVRVESHANKPLVMQEIKLFDFDAGQFQTVHEGMLPLNEDQTITILDLVDPDRFINDADGRIRLWLRTASPALSANPHKLLVDEVKLVLTYETP